MSVTDFETFFGNLTFPSVLFSEHIANVEYETFSRSQSMIVDRSN